MLKRVQIASFAVDDLKLFLDTHPCDRCALQQLCYYSRLRSRAIREYECMFGPLTADTAACCRCYTWHQGPWPWEAQTEVQ